MSWIEIAQVARQFWVAWLMLVFLAIAFERLAPGAGHALLPAHRVLLVESGIYIIETLDLEGAAAAGLTAFLFVLSPLRLVGATGSPVRPLAIVPGSAA